MSSCPFHTLFQTEAGATASKLGPRIAILAYGAVAYAAFVAIFLYAVGFVGNWLVPKSIDSGAAGPVLPSLLINTALLSVFVLQHTIMARPAFKRWWTQYVPRSIERSTFVLATCVALALAFAFWQPAPQTLWNVETPWLALAIHAVSLFGWLTVFFSSFVINHFDLFGLRQTWTRFRDRPPTPVQFQLRGPYRLVRHPLMVGFIIAFWATPHMTVGHLFFAVMTTVYILMGIWFEERDLVANHGEDYLAYRRRVRALVPLPRFTAEGGR